ncbi:hypothetical protein NDU88_005276 [Pleurodeles waltl]|uniref:Apolipoprotein L3 n=1 Tax=Pleurodeles waltl TaxID=8319 RepID=A0AAV7V664_PLEWA|nr:hypothetical protein NDU88_005276 [Pleurodeles waltl]
MKAGELPLVILFKRVEKLCDQLEDFNHVVSVKKHSLAKHAANLHFVADEIDKVHREVTKGQVVGAGIAVGGGLIATTGIALEVFKKASPLTYIAAEAISLLGNYYQSTSWSKEQEEDMKNGIIANKILDSCEHDLQVISDMYRIIQARFMFLEEEEGLHGTIFHKKLTEIQIRFPHILPPKIKRNHVDFKSQLSSFVLNVAMKSGLITLAKDSFFGSSYDAPQFMKDADFKQGTALSTKVSRTSKVIQVAQAASTAVFLYQNSKELYKGIIHLNEGARSELAENMREVAAHIEEVIRSLDENIPKEQRWFESWLQSGL